VVKHSTHNPKIKGSNHFQAAKDTKMGEGKTTAIVSANVNVLSATFPFSVLPSGSGGGGNGKYIDVSRKR
jgi:hypothetical protein